MAGSLRHWPQWPEFTPDQFEDPDYCSKLKQTIVEEYGEEALRLSWSLVCDRLQTVTAEIIERGAAMIPELTSEEFFKLSDNQQEQLRSRGCFVVRQVVPEEEARIWFNELKTYIQDNKESNSVHGWPTQNPILKLYYTPTQMAARSHPNQLALQRQLNKLWHDSTGTTSPDPLTYCDAFKIRNPGLPFFGLGPHMDAGSLCRWADPRYRSVYHAIFSGRPFDVDLYDLGVRQNANQALFEGGAQSTVLRTFQGWTAISDMGPDEGGMLLYPELKAVIAYVLLRPFFKEPENSDDIMDAAKWNIDLSSPWFPGTFKLKSQMASLSSHPHLRLRECMVHLPVMKPGDTVWWHCDMLHAVEVEHTGKHDTAVIYIGATPTTTTNQRYIDNQLQDYLNGHIPHDFRPGFDADERLLKGFVGEKAIGSKEGLRSFGILV